MNRISLLSNNPDKVQQLEDHGINVEERIPLLAGIGDNNREYLKTKIERMGHEIDKDNLQ